MAHDMFPFERLATERYRDMQRELGQRHMLAVLPRQHGNVARHVVSRLGALLVALGTRLERVEQRGGQVAHSIDLHAM